MKSSLVSIIVPVYNVADYLPKCLDSIFVQTFNEWECILVDDGSKDGSGSICDGFSSRDSRFVSLHQENKGVSAARNNGLRNASGEWILFVDSDDYLEKDYLQNYVDSINDKIDIVYGGYRPFGAVRTGMKGVQFRNMKYSLETINDAIPSLLSYCTPWGKMYRYKIIIEHSLRFEERLCVSEDRLFLYRYLKYIRGATFINYSGYNYRVLESSLMNRTHSLDILYLRMRLIWNAALELKEKWNLPFFKFVPFYEMHCGYVTELFRLVPSSNDRHELYQSYIGNFFYEGYKQCDQNKRKIIKASLGNKKYFFSQNECFAKVLLLGVRIKSVLRCVNLFANEDI